MHRHHRSLRLAPSLVLGALASPFLLNQQQPRLTSSSCDSAPNHQPQMVAVYLKPDSKALLEKFLDSRGFKNKTADYICIHSEANTAVLERFQDIFGNRLAFRITGFYETPKGKAVAVGRLSNMTGEIKDTNFEVSLPLYNKSDKPDENELRMLADLPTRMKAFLDVNDKNVWKGRVPPGAVNNKKYEAIVGASYFALPVDRQIVVDGHICSPAYLDDQCHCTFVPEPKPVDPQEQKEHQKQEEEQGEGQPKECSLCRYLKAGQCADEYVRWDGCIKQLREDQGVNECFGHFVEMMRCMQAHSHYDIFTAGTDFRKLEEIAAGFQEDKQRHQQQQEGEQSQQQ